MKLVERLFWIAALIAVFLFGRWDHVSTELHALRDRLRAELHAAGVPCFAPEAATDRIRGASPRRP